MQAEADRSEIRITVVNVRLDRDRRRGRRGYVPRAGPRVCRTRDRERPVAQFRSRERPRDTGRAACRGACGFCGRGGFGPRHHRALRRTGTALVRDRARRRGRCARGHRRLRGHRERGRGASPSTPGLLPSCCSAGAMGWRSRTTVEAGISDMPTMAAQVSLTKALSDALSFRSGSARAPGLQRARRAATVFGLFIGGVAGGASAPARPRARRALHCRVRGRGSDCVLPRSPAPPARGRTTLINACAVLSGGARKIRRSVSRSIATGCFRYPSSRDDCVRNGAIAGSRRSS